MRRGILIGTFCLLLAGVAEAQASLPFELPRPPVEWDRYEIRIDPFQFIQNRVRSLLDRLFPPLDSLPWRLL